VLHLEACRLGVELVQTLCGGLERCWFLHNFLQQTVGAVVSVRASDDQGTINLSSPVHHHSLLRGEKLYTSVRMADSVKKEDATQPHVNVGEGITAHRTDGSRVSPHNLEGGNKPSHKNKGSRSVEEYTNMHQIGEGQYGQVRRQLRVDVSLFLFASVFGFLAGPCRGLRLTGDAPPLSSLSTASAVSP